MTRENGYYWVKMTADSKWDMAEFNDGLWLFPFASSGPESYYRDHELYSIYAQRIEEPNDS